MNFSEEVKSTLWSMIDEMAHHPDPFTQHPGKDFSRKRKWDFASIMKFIISLEGKSLKDELLHYFCFASDSPTNASFNQRRSCLKPAAFEFLFSSFTSRYCMDTNTSDG